MSQKSLATAFVDQLKAWGVKFIFGVTGDDLLPFLSAVSASEEIEFIGTANEAGAAFMASYYAKLTGKLGVCVASSPGSINLLEGLADAFFDGAPVLALTGQVHTAKLGTKTKQYYHQQSVYSRFASFTESVVNPQSGIRLLIKAMSRALIKRTVCHLTISANLWDNRIDAEPASFPLLVRGVKEGKQALGNLDRAVGLIQKARKPIIIVSKKARKDIVLVKELVETWGAGIITTQEAKGVISEEYPTLLGGIGQAWVPTLLAECDCILLLGSASYEDKFMPQCPIIQIEELAAQIDDRYLWDSLAGDLDFIIQLLIKRLENHQINSNWLDQIAKEKNARDNIIQQELSVNKTPIQPGFLMSILSKVISYDALVAVDEGSFMHWFDRNFRAKNQEILISSYWRSMGLAIPAAIAAQLSNPSRQVVALVGDGCFLMNLGEFTTAIKYSLPITVIVARDHLYSLERDKTLAKGFNPTGLDIPATDFSLYAKACGAKGFMVKSCNQLEQVLNDALALKEPTIVEVICASVQLPHI